MRQWASGAWDTVWAEDGSVFLADALDRPLWATLFEPHGGYVHLGPRLAASLAASLPIDWAAFVLAACWALVVALLAVFVYFASADVLRAPATRAALAVLTAFLPAAGSELLGNTINLHFYLVYGCFWALLWRSETPPALAARAVVAGAAALSDPVVVILAPLALWNMRLRSRARALVVPAVFGVGLVIQLAAMVAGAAGPQRLTRFDAGDVPLLFALRVVGSLLVGDRFLDDAWLALGRAFAFGALALVLALLAIGVARTGPATRLFVLVGSSYAAILFSLYLVGRGSAGMRPGTSHETWHLAGARFTYAPILFLAAALLALADRRAGGRAGIAILAVVVALVSANFAFRSERSLGPAWSAELAVGRSACAAGSERAQLLLAPGPFGFRLDIACERLR